MVVLFDNCINMCSLWIFIKRLGNINSVNIDILSKECKSPHKAFATFSIGINHRVKDLENTWLNAPNNRCVKVPVTGAKDINVSIIVLGCDQVKLIVVVDAVSKELVFDRCEIFLASPLEEIILLPVRENGSHEVV